MKLQNQEDAIKELHTLADSDRHSILIEGSSGCGKSYLAKKYSEFLGITDCYFIDPTVSSIKDLWDKCYEISSPFVACIENLDLGSRNASYTLLKILEEPRNNVYIVVTCRNCYNIPATILSRSCVINVPPVFLNDIQLYIQEMNSPNVSLFSTMFRNLRDINEFSKLDSSKVNYISEVCKDFDYKLPVSDVVWKLGHYSDNTPTDLILMISCIVAYAKEDRIRQYGIACIKALSESKISSSAVLAKFVFDCKYNF